jgi:cobaltochelatase CobT
MNWLTQSFLGDLRRRFAVWPKPADHGGYRVFTRAFDETVDARDLPGLLPRQRPEQAAGFEEAVRRLEIEFSTARISLGAAGAELVDDLEGSLTSHQRARTVVSFLIDHSGSMSGLRMLSALLAVEAAVEALANAGIDTEILGFTTTSWRGGDARLAWRAAGSPPNPGRLCEIRHIVYGAADRQRRIPWHLHLALRPDLLRENVDGEALQWAASRLDRARWDRRLICLISNGAPADDSTLLANEDLGLLLRHLDATEHSLRAAGIVVGFLLIGDEHIREPKLHERADSPKAAGLSLLRLVWRALLVPPAWDY